MGRRRAGVYFSEDILIEIFYRLPSRSVFRFKCVSKSWLSFISDPFFIGGYTSRASTSLQPTQWTLLERVFQMDKDMIPPCHNFLRRIDSSRFDQVQPRLSELAFRSPKQRSSDLHYEIAAISNGFLLCRLYDGTYINKLRCCMVNPITWQCFELPQLPRSNTPVFAEGFLTQVDQGLGIGTVAAAGRAMTWQPMILSMIIILATPFNFQNLIVEARIALGCLMRLRCIRSTESKDGTIKRRV